MPRYIFTGVIVGIIVAGLMGLRAVGHALPPPTNKRWSQWSLRDQRDYVRANLRHSRFAIQWLRGHRSAYPLEEWRGLIAEHKALRTKARRNLQAIERKLHPPFVFPEWFMRLVDCESGDGDGQPPYRPWWGYNTDFEGGPNFTYETWASYGGTAYASHAYYATPYQQYTITLRVLNDVGPGAWPVCSYKAGLR